MTGYYRIDEASVRAISDRVAAMTRWLAEEAPYCEATQKHLDAGTVERAYWHYGYVCAGRDFLALVERKSSE